MLEARLTLVSTTYEYLPSLEVLTIVFVYLNALKAKLFPEKYLTRRSYTVMLKIMFLFII